MSIPELEKEKIVGIALPDSWHTLRKGTMVLCFETRRRRLEARRNLSARGIQSVNITARKQYNVPDGQYGLQIIWVQVSYLVDNESIIKEIQPKRPMAVGDTLKKHIFGVSPNIDFNCPLGYFKVTTNSLGQKRVVAHSQPVSIRSFSADEMEEYKEYIKFLWEAGMINIDGVYFRPFEPDEDGYYHFKLHGGCNHGNEYDVHYVDLVVEEYSLKVLGYIRMVKRKDSESSDELECWLTSDKMNSRS